MKLENGFTDEILNIFEKIKNEANEIINNEPDLFEYINNHI